MKYEDMINQIVDLVGGPDNVSSVYHCVTRLRFKLKDPGKADIDALGKVKGAMGAINSANQIQVIVGQKVDDVYDEMQQMYHFSQNGQLVDAEDYKEEMKDKKVSSNLLDIISGLFTPILSMMVAAGVIKGLLTLCSALGLLAPTDGAYILINAIGDSFFYFLPIFLGFTAMKKFGGTPALGALMGAALIYPSIVSAASGDPISTLFAGTPFASPVSLAFFGIPVVLRNYSSTVIPIIFICAIAAPLERWLNRHVPEIMRSLVSPAVTLVVGMILGYLIVGPVISIVSDVLGLVISAIFSVAPLLAGLVYGTFIQVCVIFGVHWGFVAVGINNMATLGYDPVSITGLASAFGQAGVVLAIIVRSKDTEVRSIAWPAFVSALLGITEPAVYGVTLQRRKAFAVACVASGIGGAIIGGAGVRMYNMGANGIFGWIQAINPAVGFDGTVLASIVACIVSFVVALGATLLLWDRLDIEKPAA